MDETWQCVMTVNHKVTCNSKGMAGTISLSEKHQVSLLKKKCISSAVLSQNSINNQEHVSDSRVDGFKSNNEQPRKHMIHIS